MHTLQDKVAIITGGARGIGKATATMFAQAGAKVVIWDLAESEGLTTASQLPAPGGPGTFDRVDTTDRQAVQQAVSRIMESLGRIDILINNAGITRDATLLKMDPDQWQQVIDVNLSGVFNCTQAVAPHMVTAGSGKIISASSVVGHYGNYGQTNYVATKAGVIGMTKVWARELGPKGLNVNAVSPGFIATEMVQTIPEKVIEGITQKTPLRRMGHPDDIAQAYLFLASEAASFINGHTLQVDGGLTL